MKRRVVGTIVDSFLAHHFDLETALSTRQAYRTVKSDPHEIQRIFAKWAERVSSGDVIISFNWDLLQEIALWKAKKFDYSDGYGFKDRLEADPMSYEALEQTATTPSPVRLYKLHGSVNWAQERGDKEPSILGLQHFFPGGRFNTYKEYLKEIAPDLGRILIIPSYLKTVSASFLVQIWNHAASAREMLAKSS